MLKDVLQAALLVGLGLLAVGVPVVAVDELIGVFEGGGSGVSEGPGASDEGAVLLAEAWGRRGDLLRRDERRRRNHE